MAELAQWHALAQHVDDTQKIKTGQSTPETESLSANVRLFKLYPHHEVLFYDHKSKSLIMPCVDDGIKNLHISKPSIRRFATEHSPLSTRANPLSKLKKVPT